MKTIIAIVGPSASGKDSVVGNILEKEYGIPELISTTSRTIRVGEEDGVDYYFIDQNDKVWRDEQNFVELVEYNNNLYGLTVEEVENKLSFNDTVFCIVDIQGLCLVKEKLGSKYNVVSLFVDVSSSNNIEEKLQIIKERMVSRGDTLENIKSRLRYVREKEEFSNYQYCDHIIINDNIDNARLNIKRTLKKIRESV